MRSGILRQLFFAAMLMAVSALLITGMAQAESLRPIFHLSGEQGLVAGIAQGEAEPVSHANIAIVQDGAYGKALSCPNFNAVLAYNAPGNIYAEKGTLAFFFRPRYDWGVTPFKIFQASHADHSSFDMSFLRIDYNGGGFDAFVTDINLARVRVSHKPDKLPAPDSWTHLTLSWDENIGIRFYVDGSLVASKDSVTVLFAALGKLGTHGYMVNDLSLSAGGPDIRGGDFDEIRIYDHMLSNNDIARLSEGKDAATEKSEPRNLSKDSFRNEWLRRYGWDDADTLPPQLTAANTVIRKVEIHDAYDHKQWMWKANDGIRETTWPYVYNRSTLPGRTDYFILPDWNCYSVSGKSITFTLPDEPWNYVEISGAAFGKADFIDYDNEKSSPMTRPLFERPEDRERTFHQLDAQQSGGKLRFTNDVMETPIGELNVYNIAPGQAPSGTARLTYSINPAIAPDHPSLDELNSYITGRYMQDERATAIALPSRAPGTKRQPEDNGSLPLVHVLIPFEYRNISGDQLSRYSYTWENIDGGLDGILLNIPALDVAPTHDGLLPMNVRVQDPIWPDRSLIDVSFTVRPGEAREVWLDIRDKVLPDDKSLYLTIAAAGADFSMESLNGGTVTLIFKDRETATVEQEIDRFTQIRDNFGNLMEAGPNSKALGLYKRFNEDISDLLSVNPSHMPGRYYWSYNNPEQGWPAFKQPEAPAGTPLWAFRQIEYLKKVSDIILWWIDNRQIENGELGGGLSDDSDYTNVWPIPALNGVEPEKVTDSLDRLMEAIYDNGMLTNGINTITADGLHTTEEGNNVQGQLMLLKYGDPKLMERMMESVRGFETVTGVNDAGHLHFRSGYFGAHHIATEEPWVVSRYQTSRILHPAMYVAEFSGHPRAQKLILGLADGLLAHRREVNGRWITPANINFATDEDEGGGHGNFNHVFWGAWCWTRDNKYLQPLTDNGPGPLSGINASAIDILGKRDSWGVELAGAATPQNGSTYARHMAWKLSGNKQFLEEYYADEIQFYSQRNYLYTEGHFWTDRVRISAAELQRSRLGGVGKRGKGNIYPGQTVSWKFMEPSTWEDLAILMPLASEREFTVIAYNLSDQTVKADMTGWMIDPGMWEMVKGIDRDGDDVMDSIDEKKTLAFERTKSISLSFEPRVQTVITFKLKKKGKAYWKRHDLGIGPDDIARNGRNLTVTVHSLGAVKSPVSRLALVTADGAILAEQLIPEIEAPLDLYPRTTDITLTIPAGADLNNATINIISPKKSPEITELNNVVGLP